MVHTYYSFTISYGRYAINDPMTSFAAADECDLCRNTIFVEHGTEQWKQLRDAQEMPKGWMWQEKGPNKRLLGTIVTIGQKTYLYFQTVFGDKYNNTIHEFSLSPDFAMCLSFYLFIPSYFLQFYAFVFIKAL